MIFTLLTSLVITQFLNPLIANFERDVVLKQALQGEQIVASAPVRINPENLAPKLTSEASIVVDQSSRQVLWSSNQHKAHPIASISKLMTALVFLDQEPDLSQEFTLLSSDLAGAGVQYIGAGETVMLKDLLFVSLIASDNNAAKALIRASGLEYDEFIEQMNEKAKDLQMFNTNFVEPTGLRYANISSAQDVVLLLEAALAHDLVADIIRQPSYRFVAVGSGKTYRVKSTNKLIGTYLDIVGGKTGFNNEGQFNLATAVRGPKGQVLLVVTLGSNAPEARFQDVKAMTDWTLRNNIWP